MSLEDDNNFALERLMEQYKTREQNRLQNNKKITTNYVEQQDDTDFVKETLVNVFLKEFDGKGNNRW